MKKKHRYWTDWVRLQSNRQLLAKYDEVFEVQERQGYRGADCRAACCMRRTPRCLYASQNEIRRPRPASA
jgi:hypothetical protein